MASNRRTFLKQSISMHRRSIRLYQSEAVNGTAPDISRLVRDFPPRRETSEQGEFSRGLPVRLSFRRNGAAAEIHLGEEAKFFPTDAALASWTAQADKGLAQVVYE